MKRRLVAPVSMLCVALPLLASAQAPPAAPAKPDSPEVRALVEKTRKTAGTQWAEEVHFFCEAPRANAATDPPIAPTKIFDNVYAIGNQGTVVYVVQTSAGLLMFDSLAANLLNTQLLPGFQALGLNPADVKMILMGHGHADHFGGSPYFQYRVFRVVDLDAMMRRLMEDLSGREDLSALERQLWQDEFEARVRIEDLEIMEGSNLPPRATRLILDWSRLHQDELAEAWERARRGEPNSKIEPLP